MTPAIFIILGLLLSTGDNQTIDNNVPSIVEVQKQAIDYARLNPSEISSWKKRSRLSALLPRLQVDYADRYQNGVNMNINDSIYVGSSGSTVGPSDGGVSQNINADQNWGFRAIWNLPDTVFNPDMLAVSEEARLLARERQALLSEVNRHYFARERAFVEVGYLEDVRKESAEKGKASHEIVLKKMVIDEETSALDALTGGWFSEQIRKNGVLGKKGER